MKISWHAAMLIGCLLLGATAHAARILVLLPLPVKSHVIAYTPYIEELAIRGHEVTVVSAFPRKTPLANYTDIVLSDTFPPRDSKEFDLFRMKNASFISLVLFVYNLCYKSCEKVLKDPNMQKLIHSNGHEFDLIIYEAFYTECTYGLLHKFKVPSIQIVPNSLFPWIANSVGNPNTISYIPAIVTNTDNLDFQGRLCNFLRAQFMNVFRKFYVIPQMDALLREQFPDPTIPSIEELETNTSFLFLHSHPVLHYPRPLTPNTIEVGGLHIRKPQKLPQDLQEFLDNATDGVIYFSLGSNVRSVDMSNAVRDSFLRAFSKLKQKVLWKWEKERLPGQPTNIRLAKWLPQNDILAHPNVKLFITQAGLMSVQEATYFGVPLITIPIMADQTFNAMRVRNAGLSILLSADDITEETLYQSIKEMLDVPRYRENAKRLSNIFRDQPQTPMERAVYWTEYAIRHKGAPHMRSAALDLNVFQYYLLDVIAVLSLVGLTALALLVVFVRKVAMSLCSKSSKTKSALNSKKRQ